MRFSRASFVPCVYSVRSGAVCCGASEAFFFGLDAQMRSEFPLPHAAAAVCLLTELPERENSTLCRLLPTFQMSKNKKSLNTLHIGSTVQHSPAMQRVQRQTMRKPSGDARRMCRV